MTTPLRIKGSFALCALVALAHAKPAHACSRDPFVGYSGFAYPVPRDVVAPRNVKIWVPPIDAYSSIAETDVVIEANNVVVPATASHVVVDGEAKGTILVFTPDTPLPSGASVTVTVQNQLVSQFTVGTDDDLTAPPTPTVASVDVEGAYFGGFSCPEPSVITVTVGSNDEMLVLTSSATSELPGSVLAMAVGERATAVDLAEGDHALHVLAVDAAGNASASTPVPTFTVPTEQSGCSVGARPSSWALAAIGALLVRRRRR